MAATGVLTASTLISGHAGKTASCKRQDVVDLVENEADDSPGQGASAAASSQTSKGKRAGKTTKAGTSIAKPQQVQPANQEQYFTPEELQQVRVALLSWYDSSHRVLPWRRTPRSTRTLPAPAGPHEAAEPAPGHLDAQQFAYYVWVSEVMLQQTQVATVIPYFQKWVTRWPTVASLAAADVDAVNEMWAGLGYYRRARYLLDGAKHVMTQLGGAFPTTAKAMLSIPGVGPYTSAAVASIAFSDTAAVVDGNVIRVLSRLRALSGDPTTQSALHATMAQQLLDVERPGDFNQAVMELGARVCRPQAPDCASCPASTICKAYQQWHAYVASGGSADVEDAPVVTQYPGKKEAKTKKEQLMAVCVVELICAGNQQGLGVGKQDSSSLQVDDEQGSHQQKQSVGSRVKGNKQQDQADASGQAAGRTTGRKRQATLFDFIPQAPPSKQARGIATAPAAHDPTANTAAPVVPLADPAAVARLLSDASQRRVLLVQRPAEGLLAGLWELPSVLLDAEQPYSRRKVIMDEYLQSLLGPHVVIDAGQHASAQHGRTQAQQAETQFEQAVVKAHVVRRHEAGSYIHIFSHIRQTNYIERLVLLVDNLDTFLAAVAASGSAASTPALEAITVEPSPADNSQKASAVGDAEKAGTQKSKRPPRKAGSQGSKTKPVAASVKPSIKWVLAKDLSTAGISTAPDRMYAMAVGADAAGKKGGKGAGNTKSKGRCK